MEQHDMAATAGERFDPDGHVYVLAGGGYHKIGRARSSNIRVASLKTQMPFEVELVHVFPCEDVVRAEHALHRRFADVRANGEWFVLRPEDLEFLKSIGRMRGEEVEFGKAQIDKGKEKRNYTFLISDQVSAEMDRLRTDFRLKYGLKVSRSEISEIALRAAIEDVRKRGKDSAVAKRLSGRLRRRRAPARP